MCSCSIALLYPCLLFRVRLLISLVTPLREFDFVSAVTWVPFEGVRGGTQCFAKQRKGTQARSAKWVTEKLCAEASGDVFSLKENLRRSYIEVVHLLAVICQRCFRREDASVGKLVSVEFIRAALCDR